MGVKNFVRFILRKSRNLKTGIRLGLGFGFLLMSVAAISVFMFRQFSDIAREHYPLIATVVLAAFMVGLIAALLIARSITRPLDELIEVTRKMAAGDFSSVLESDAKDETGEVARAVSSVQKSLRQLAADGRVLSRAARDGKVTTRLDVANFCGDYRMVGDGVNQLLDVVIDPLNVGADYLLRVARGEIPPKITGQCESGRNTNGIGLAETVAAINLVLASTAKLKVLEDLENSDRLIRLDYPYRPKRRPWDEATSRIYRLIHAGSERYAALLEEIAALAPFLERIQVSSDDPADLAPRWANSWFPPLDALSLYGLLALHNPRQYVEVGSGNSTMFARQAIRDHGLRTRIISIDPFPRADIDSICDNVLRLPFEEVPAAFFESLTAEDILFVDNSHRAFPNSDVTIFFSEVLPQLPRGTIYGLHDIFLPWDYPDEWSDRYYNEQYLLAAYLLGGANGDEIVLPNVFLSYYSPHSLNSLNRILSNPQLAGIQTGGAFWLKRG